MSKNSKELGEMPIGKLLFKQSLPAMVGFLVMSIYQIVDTYFVGQFVGFQAIGAITIVMPLTFLITSIGMAIGIGGASIISRALGEGKQAHAENAFGNQIVLAVVLGVGVTVGSMFFVEEILVFMGAGEGTLTLELAVIYFENILYTVPLLILAMMFNNTIRAEGKATIAMLVLLVPAVLNVALDYLLIQKFGWGMEGAAYATAIGYVGSFAAGFFFYLSGKSELKLAWNDLKLKWHIVKETFAIGGITLIRQGSFAVLAFVLNNKIDSLNGEVGQATYGVVSRVSMFALFPVIGIMQGFMPIASYNYGSKQYDRVREVIIKAIVWGTIISTLIFVLIYIFAPQVSEIFTDEAEVLKDSPFAMRMIFLAVPLVAMQFIGASYYQAINKPWPALFLTLIKQGLLLIPLVLILPSFYDLDGVWYSFPISDAASAIITFFFLRYQMKVLMAKA